MKHLKPRLKKILFTGIVFSLAASALTTLSYHAKANGLSLVRDTEIEATLKEWGTPVFEAADLNPDAVNIILVQNDAVNAFVAGGPNIFFYTGLISTTEDPGELIGVLAHETGHISGGHLIRTREALERASYESIVATILGVGAAIASGEAGAVPAIALGGSSVAQRKFLAHSRIQESSADQAAMTFLENAKINPTGLVTFMDKLKAEAYVPETQQSEYVRTHPLVDNRIEVLERRVASSALKDTAYPARWIEQHKRIKAKLIGFTNPKQIPWVYDDRDVSIPAQYARAIAAYQDNAVSNALKRIDALITLEPDNPYFLELKGQMLVDFGRVSEALPYYRKASALVPDKTLINIALAHALIESAKDHNPDSLQEAIGYLELSLRDEPRSTRIHRLLATAYGRLNQHNRAKIHLAEEAVLQRRYGYAQQHAKTVLAQEKEGAPLWIRAKDILSFIKTVKNG